MKGLDLLFRVIQANRGLSPDPDDRLAYAEGLGLKLFFHAASALYLARGTIIPDFPSVKVQLGDESSINVIARAAFETFLVFHYVFVEPKSLDEKNYRFWVWKANGVAVPHDIITYNNKGKLTFEQYSQELDSIQRNLSTNSIFLKLNNRQQKRVLEKYEWRLNPGDERRKSWRDIAFSAGLGRAMSSGMYKVTSGYTHSDSHSIYQMKVAAYEHALKHRSLLQKISIGAALNNIAISIACFIRGYCGLFPDSMVVLESDEEGKTMIDEWIEVGKILGEDDKQD